MGWFSPVKGAYPSLGQVDKTLPLSADVEKLERGMIVALNPGTNDKEEKNGVWALPKATDKLLYVALQDSSDPTAGFAGTSFDPKGGVPCITALDLNQDAEYETSVFDGDVTYAVGDPLKANSDGILTKSTGENDVVVGYVTGVPTDRWVNNAIAVPPWQKDQRLAYRTGATVSVLRFKTK